MKKLAQSIKTEIEDLTSKLKNNEISTEEAFIIFERIILDLSAIYGDNNLFIKTLKNDFSKQLLRLNKIDKLKKRLNILKEEELLLMKKYLLEN